MDVPFGPLGQFWEWNFTTHNTFDFFSFVEVGARFQEENLEFYSNWADVNIYVYLLRSIHYSLCRADLFLFSARGIIRRIWM